MDWREAPLGGRVNKGWEPLVDRLHAAVLDLDPDVRVVQVKEKFGGLRYYYETSDDVDELIKDRISALVAGHEIACAYTCEVCGESGLRNDWGQRWVNTLCDKHGEIRRETGAPVWQMSEQS